jgi:hypothetical protein
VPTETRHSIRYGIVPYYPCELISERYDTQPSRIVNKPRDQSLASARTAHPGIPVVQIIDGLRRPRAGLSGGDLLVAAMRDLARIDSELDPAAAADYGRVLAERLDQSASFPDVRGIA